MDGHLENADIQLPQRQSDVIYDARAAAATSLDGGGDDQLRVVLSRPNLDAQGVINGLPHLVVNLILLLLLSDPLPFGIQEEHADLTVTSLQGCDSHVGDLEPQILHTPEAVVEKALPALAGDLQQRVQGALNVVLHHDFGRPRVRRSPPAGRGLVEEQVLSEPGRGREDVQPLLLWARRPHLAMRAVGPQQLLHLPDHLLSSFLPRHDVSFQDMTVFSYEEEVD